MGGVDEVPPEQQWTGMTIEMTNAAGERWRLTPHRAAPPGRGPTLKFEMEREDDFDWARRRRPPFTSAGQRLVVDVPARYDLELLPPKPPTQVWACFNGYLGNGYVAVLVEADDEQAARVAAARALAEHPEGKSPFGDRSEQWSTIERVRRLTLPHVCELG